MHSVKENAYAVLLPAFADMTLSSAVREFLSSGGCSILLGETREEYVARDMTALRKQQETMESFRHVTGEARALAGSVLVAVDQEIAGICRLHHLVPPFPAKGELAAGSNGAQGLQAFEALSTDIAKAARVLGVNCFLGPILDVVTGANPWLSGRTWSKEPATIGKVSAAYIRGLQAGGVAATAKHFPGYSQIALDPAIEGNARNVEGLDVVEQGLSPFRDAIVCGVDVVMTGPAVVEAYDSENAASVSPDIVLMLRERFGFKGVILSDDLDAKGVLQGGTVPQMAVKALNAGVDWLLLADIGGQVQEVADTIVAAVASGELAEERLADAATKVRGLAARYDCANCVS